MQKNKTPTELVKLQIEAKNLIEIEGKNQKDVSNILMVSEKTIGSWVEKFKWTSNTAIIVKQKKAKELIVKHGLKQKEAANAVGVSEKTIGCWCKKFQWKADTNFIIPNASQIKYSVSLFAKYFGAITGNGGYDRKINASIDGFIQHVSPAIQLLKEDKEEQWQAKQQEYYRSKIDFNQEWDD